MNLTLQRLLIDSKKINLFFWIIISIGLIVYKLSFHELWKDEWQAWLVARDLSLSSMLAFLNYEGHPSLWYLYLKAWTILPIQEHILLQMSHGVLVVVALYYLFVRIGLPTLWKVLISFSYFIVFEYGVINRGYILVILLSIIALDLIVRNNKSWILGLTLLLLCQTEAYGVIITAAIIVYLFLNSEGNKLILFRKTILWSLTGFLLFVFTVFPRGNEDDFTRAYNQQSFSIKVIHESIQGHLANVFTIGLIDDTASNGVSSLGFMISILLLYIIVWIFVRDRRILLSMIFGLLAFIIFGMLIFSGGVRQWGMVYLLFILMLILSHHKKSKWSFSRYVLVITLMIAPMVHGIKALITDIQIPFSNAQEVGQFIEENVPYNVPVVVINKFETAPVGAYADRSLYELPSGEEFTYFRWLEKVYIPTQSEISLFARFKNVGGIVLLSPSPIDPKRFPNAVLWQEFSNENFKRENYWLYSVPLTK